jgi:hypothetical protein
MKPSEKNGKFAGNAENMKMVLGDLCVLCGFFWSNGGTQSPF